MLHPSNCDPRTRAVATQTCHRVPSRCSDGAASRRRRQPGWQSSAGCGAHSGIAARHLRGRLPRADGGPIAAAAGARQAAGGPGDGDALDHVCRARRWQLFITCTAHPLCQSSAARQGACHGAHRARAGISLGSAVLELTRDRGHASTAHEARCCCGRQPSGSSTCWRPARSRSCSPLSSD